MKNQIAEYLPFILIGIIGGIIIFLISEIAKYAIIGIVFTKSTQGAWRSFEEALELARMI